MNRSRTLLIAGLFLLGLPLRRSLAAEAWDRISQTGELRWGADATGGAPYVFPDPDHPEKFVGFEMDIMEALGRELHVKPRLVLTPWDQLVPALLRDDFDIAFNGLEITPDRKQVIDFSQPYYLFSEQITVRKGTFSFDSLKDLEGHKVGTLSAALAQTLMVQHGHITVVPYPSPVEIYKDLELGRTDAALLDVPIAAWYAGPNPKLANIGAPIGEGLYGAGLRKDSPLLKAKLDAALAAISQSGELETIYRKWNIWNAGQSKLKKNLSGVAKSSEEHLLARYFPLLLKGAGMTVILSVCAMALAVIAGFSLCLARLYGGRWLSKSAGAYIEVVRGTPLLIQLYLLYYGLPNIGIQLNAFVAAVLGMGLNYAAYESEIYRAGLLSIPKGQEEAARSLGMTHGQSLRYVIVPQAFRTILPPSTNDFIALFKDTSLVSIITVTELTRAYNLAATATYRFLELGLATALLYFAMSYPLSVWSRALERKRHVIVH